MKIVAIVRTSMYALLLVSNIEKPKMLRFKLQTTNHQPINQTTERYFCNICVFSHKIIPTPLTPPPPTTTTILSLTFAAYTSTSTANGYRLIFAAALIKATVLLDDNWQHVIITGNNMNNSDTMSQTIFVL